MARRQKTSHLHGRAERLVEWLAARIFEHGPAAFAHELQRPHRPCTIHLARATACRRRRTISRTTIVWSTPISRAAANGTCSIWTAEIIVPVSGRYLANNADVLRTTAIAGGGIILLPTFIVGDDLRAGRLMRLLPNYPPPEQALHVLYPPGRHLSAKARSFVDFWVARFGGEPTWDRG